MNARQTALFVLLLVAIIGSGWFLDGRFAGLQDLTVSDTGPDAFASGMHLAIMDAGGGLQYRITAATMTHYPGTKHMELSNPLIDMQQRNGNTWRISAERGETSDSGERVRLLGSVDIRRSGASGPLQVRTRDLLVRPQQNLASTDEAATISAPGQRVEAVGLDADFGNNTLELRSRVRGRIDAAG